MFSDVWNNIFINPMFNLLIALFKLTGNLGLAIILLTLVVRTILIPLVMPSMHAMQKQKELQPEIDKIKKKFKNDKQKQAEAQMALFKQHGLNPAAGCLPQIAMIVVLIALYGVISRFSKDIDISQINIILYFDFLKFASDAIISTKFGYLDLAKADPYFVLAILSGALQFVVSKMMQPYNEKGRAAAKSTPDKTDDFAYNMQGQMLYMMPIMTVIISLKLPAGAVLYILTTTVFSAVQQYFVTGWGGLAPIINKWKSKA